MEPVLAAIAHLPQMVHSRLEMPKLTRAMRHILESSDGEKYLLYVQENLGGHGGQLMASFLVSGACLLANFVSVLLIDMTLKNTFFTIPMGFSSIWSTDNQSDYTKLFPLTTRCIINQWLQRTVVWM